MIRVPYGRILSAVIALAAIAVAAVAFEEKRNSAIAAAEVTKLKRQIAAERDRIADLKAEWALLDQPERLQGIATRYASVLHLQLLDPTTQIATLSDIPARPAQAAGEDGAAPQPPAAGPGPVASAPAAPRQGDAIDALLSGGAGAVPAAATAPPATAAAPVPQPAAGAAAPAAEAGDAGDDVQDGVGSIDELLSGEGNGPAGAPGNGPAAGQE
ncbi:hypothetical protein [Pseudoxanthobacter sp.]|uniref:cell division protein FtsL n=1 Tax=Pseudoxanthobacter sp. TaxID=1925742 RepID=UPI002FE37A76